MMNYLKLIPLILLMGCVTTTSVNKQYETVDFANGIGSDEAVIIAQKEFLSSRESSLYKLKTAVILRDRFVRDYDDYWFVQFSPKSFDYSFWRFLVVIDRSTGDVIHKGPYVPLEVVDYDWVFKNKN